MIKKILICLAALIGAIAYFTPDSYHAHSNSGGSPSTSNAGYTGSPKDNGVTCRSCHDGAAATTRDNVISTNIPGTGYVPGTTYNINVTVSEAARNKFGFEVVSEAAGKLRKGIFIAGTGSRTLLSASKITHSSSGTAGSNNSKTWSFQWTAPAAGTGDITFYGAFNAANGNNNDSGDNIYKFATNAIPEDISAGVSEYIYGLNNQLSVFPNPATDVITIKAKNQPKSVVIYTVSGSKVSDYSVQGDQINVSKLNTGVYFIQTDLGVTRFVKQ